MSTTVVRSFFLEFPTYPGIVRRNPVDTGAPQTGRFLVITGEFVEDLLWLRVGILRYVGRQRVHIRHPFWKFKISQNKKKFEKLQNLTNSSRENDWKARVGALNLAAIYWVKNTCKLIIDCAVSRVFLFSFRSFFTELGNFQNWLSWTLTGMEAALLSEATGLR